MSARNFTNLILLIDTNPLPNFVVGIFWGNKTIRRKVML